MSEFSFAMLTPLLPEIVLALAGMVLLVAGAARGNTATAFTSLATMGSFALAVLFLLGLSWDRTAVFGSMFVLDEFAGYMKLLVLAGLIAVVAISGRYLEQESMARFEYPLLILFAGIGMMIMISSGSLLTMYMGLELQSLSLYVLAAIRRNHVKSAEAGVKYFVLGALASGMLLFGISLVYGFAGSVGYEQIEAALRGAGAVPGAIIGMVFILVGLAFKISAVPFHMWTPDVYEGAPTSVTALFAIVPKIAAMALLMRLLFEPFGPVAAQWQQVIWCLAAASMILGSFAALRQTNIKRLMAYSSIANMGYALIGLLSATPEGAGAVVVYLILYMIMTAGTFCVILYMRRGDIAAEEIGDLAGLSRTAPLMAYAMAILMFSMSGIPPLAGFFGKLLIFKAAVDSGFMVLAVLGVLSSVVAAYYYLRIIKVMFFDDPADVFDRQMSFASRAVLLVSVGLVLFFILSPATLIETSMNAASALFIE